MTTQNPVQIQKVKVQDLVISEPTKKLYDYTNRKSEIDSIKESISKIGLREPIVVIRYDKKYLIVDGVLRYEAMKSLNLNEVEVIVSRFDSNKDFSLTDFIIHHHIRKEKTPQEKLNEIRSTLRVDQKDKNPSRDKEQRVNLVSKVMGGKGWGRNNVFSLEKIMKWEDENDHQLGLSEKLVANEIKVFRAQEAISLIEENDFDVESENESQLINEFLKGSFDKNRTQNLITVYRMKKKDSPTDLSGSELKDENFEIILGNAETIELPDDLKIDTIFTSPPYYKLRKYGDDPNELGWEKTPQEFVKRLADILMRGYEKLNESGSMFINMGETYEDVKCLAVIDRLTLELIDRGARFIDKIIWEKRANKPASNSNKRLKNSYEVILHFAKTKNYYFERFKIDTEKRLKVSPGCKEHFYNQKSYHIPNKYSSPDNLLGDDYLDNILKIQQGKNRTQHIDGESEHPATFPTTLPLIPLLISCPKSPNTVVFDPFSGTSSTGITALSLGFSFVGVELYEENIETSKRVLRDHMNQFSPDQITEKLDELGISQENLVVGEPDFNNAA